MRSTQPCATPWFAGERREREHTAVRPALRLLGSSAEVQTNMLRSCCFVMLAAVGALAAAGCHATVEPEPVAATYEVTYGEVPTDIEAQPHTYYEGRPVYLYQGHWYYRDSGRWAYYRHEPPALYQYRQRNYVQQAPPAQRSYPPGGYPQHYDRDDAPPAVRTR
jgi:hypothetical protein